MRTPSFHGNIVVSNLPEGFTAVELAALFDDFGLVLGAEMDRNRLRQGSIILAPEPAVAKAIEALNGQLLAERALKVVRAPVLQKRPKSASAPRPARPPTPLAAEAPHEVADAVRRFRNTIDVAAAAPGQPMAVSPAPTRQVVVEYRKTRRIEIPPRPLRSDGAALKAPS
jgi:RNA recognition motif-containing protein